MNPVALSIIRDEHRALTAVIQTLQLLARQAAAGAEPDYELFTVILDYIETFPNRFHHPKEDEYLFRALRRRSAEAGPVLDELEAEHRQGDDLTRDLRYRLARCRVGGREAVTDFAAAAEAYAGFHWKHLRTEEEVVMPLAERALTPDDWAAIDAAFLENDDPALGAGPRREFEGLFRLILHQAPPPMGVGAARGRDKPA